MLNTAPDRDDGCECTRLDLYAIVIRGKQVYCAKGQQRSALLCFSHVHYYVNSIAFCFDMLSFLNEVMHDHIITPTKSSEVDSYMVHPAAS